MSSADKLVRAEALDVVLSSDPPDGVEMACKAIERHTYTVIDDLQDPVCLTALDYLAGRTDKECLRSVRELLTKNAHPKNAPRGYVNLVGSLAADVLLRSSDQEARKQAIGWIESLLADPDQLGTWEQAVGLVGQHRLSQSKAYLTGSKIQGEQKVTAAAALAKLGDVSSQRFLREKVSDPRFFCFIVSDLELVKLLGLSKKEIENAVSAEKWAKWEQQGSSSMEKEARRDEAETVIAAACATLGYPERLRDLGGELRELSRTNTDRSRNKTVLIVYAIRDVGDKSMIPTLEGYFVAAPDDVRKLDASLAIVKILQREKAKHSGKEPSTSH